MEFLMNTKRAPTNHHQHPLTTTTASTTTIGESPIRRTTTLVVPNHDHFTVSPMAKAFNPMRENSILLASPSNSLQSPSSSSNGSLQKHKNHQNNHHNKKKHYPRNGHRQPMSPTNELRLQLLQRMAEYRSKGWINPAEERTYIQRLTRHQPTDFTDHTARQLQQEMDHIAEMVQRQPRSNAAIATTTTTSHHHHHHHHNNRIGGGGMATPLIPPSGAMRSPPPPALKKKKSNLSSTTSSSSSLVAARLPPRRVSFALMTTESTTNDRHPTKGTSTRFNDDDDDNDNDNNTNTTSTANSTASNKHSKTAPSSLPDQKSIPKQKSIPDKKSNPEKEPSEKVSKAAPVSLPSPIVTEVSTPETPLPSILEPTALWNQLQEYDNHDDNNGDTSSSSTPYSNTSIIQNMFVEMCFFARLGFVQPPCCLYCAYRESVEKQAPRLDCKRWVVWRKNALTLLHPHRLQDNLLAVQCKTARQLSHGVTVDAHAWNVQRKQLLLHM